MELTSKDRSGLAGLGGGADGHGPFLSWRCGALLYCSVVHTRVLIYGVGRVQSCVLARRAGRSGKEDPISVAKTKTTTIQLKDFWMNARAAVFTGILMQPIAWFEAANAISGGNYQQGGGVERGTKKEAWEAWRKQKFSGRTQPCVSLLSSPTIPPQITAALVQPLWWPLHLFSCPTCMHTFLVVFRTSLIIGCTYHLTGVAE